MPAISLAMEDLLGQFCRYILVGGLAFAVDFGTLYALVSVLGVNYLVAAAIAFLAGLILNYALSVGWVFKERKLSSARNEFVLFALIGVVGLGINEAVLWLLVGGLGLQYLLSKALSAALILAWNFCARKAALF